ncbi:adenine phosphoribosyltransferase [Marinitoga sp. 1135]|uniref:Adenine phosphoribosyltransferase n=1 Tax=Marinitoga piezophila (strain DSM 14283 / JCM 11233 / KA3) TaxID=443254 RepID=H2J2S2_MARPK|nr:MULTISPECIES: adenine phosphoribosyltransferase [Marinitoga]AEX84516.1 adenine phosphoribosyltransferase [Marinitoga piezophila KA3]APT75009.1 adenine phosphoribosyltransferase [Marinitoga sp. 1137]NUU94765.1 adenine phosphoribosyltransferase [Marinitoga sp. 1135]NUU96694.1 adenine phosphoribosyltransferase [Marinitoga sp. 1138]
MNFEKFIRDIPDFPKPGIIFKDITPLLADPEAFKGVIDEMAEKVKDIEFDAILVPEARGFLFGSALAYKLGKKLVPVRKPGKLPYEVVEVSYALEYGEAKIQMHKDALEKGEKVLIVDDVLATGGTIKAIQTLVEKLEAEVSGIICLIELEFLNPREKLDNVRVESILKY